MIGIGIDTGGTCTDAVIYDFETGKILGAGKALTTKEHLETGIANALDQLPEELLEQAQMAALSTTLATNACLENKGARAKLLLIGFDRGMMEHLKDLYASYGLDDLTRFVVLDAKAEGLYEHPYDPDWEDLRARAGEYFDDADSVGIVQMNPKSNGGRFELTALRVLREELSQPVTIAFDISRETDILKTCAGTMLNARLIPLISEFMQAVHHVLEDRGLHIPISIVRSDGTLMPEEMAFSYPVETILCGPSASVVGGAALARGALDRKIPAEAFATVDDIPEPSAIADNFTENSSGSELKQEDTPSSQEYCDQEDVEDVSIKDGKNREMSGIVVDMGGTTTDIALIRDGEPLMAEEGIHIGQWKTMVRGLYVETVGLGGDTAVRYDKDGKLYLDTVRVIPVSVLAAQYDHVLPALEELAERAYFSSNQVHEFYVLVKDISGKSGYSETEQRLCQILKKKPLITMELAERMGCYHRFLHTERLEKDGVILKSGLTATDMMILKGDFTLYDGAAARAALRCLAVNTGIAAEKLPDCVYEMVSRRMYDSIGRVILQKEYPGLEETFTREYLEPLLECFYAQAKERVERAAAREAAATCEAEAGYGAAATERKKPTNPFAGLQLTSQLPLIGVGAPIHVFLPRVAQLLGTTAIIPAYAEVANALGAAACKRAVHCELIIKAEYDGAEFTGLSLYEEGRRYTFEEIEPATAFGRAVMERMLRKQAAMRGMTGDLQLHMEVEENRFGHTAGGVLFEIKIEGSVSAG